MSNARQNTLEGVKAIDLSGHPSGMVVARVLHDWGAEVGYVGTDHPADAGSRDRSRLMGRADVRQAYVHAHRRGIRGYPDAESALAEINPVDVVIVGGLDEVEDIRTAYPQAVLAVITEFPSSSRYARWTGSEMIHQALSGAMAVTGSLQGPPLYGVGHRAYYTAGWTAIVGILGALLSRLRTGRGQVIDISVYEACAAMAQNLVAQYSYSGTWPERARYGGMVKMIRCKDGWLVLFAYFHWPAMCRAFRVPHLLDVERFQSIEGRTENWEELSDLLQEAARELSVEEVVGIAQSGKVAAAKVASITEILEDPYFQENLWAAHTGDSSEGASLASAFVFEQLASELQDSGERGKK